MEQIIIGWVLGLALAIAGTWVYGKITSQNAALAQSRADNDALIQSALKAELELKGMKSTLEMFKDKPVVAVLNDQQMAAFIQHVLTVINEKIERGEKPPKVH